MSKLHEALELLKYSIENLEGSVSVVEEKLGGYQHDMFGQPSNENDASSASNVEVLAQRLDTAIEKVERILREA